MNSRVYSSPIPARGSIQRLSKASRLCKMCIGYYGASDKHRPGLHNLVPQYGGPLWGGDSVGYSDPRTDFFHVWIANYSKSTE